MPTALWRVAAKSQGEKRRVEKLKKKKFHKYVVSLFLGASRDKGNCV